MTLWYNMAMKTLPELTQSIIHTLEARGESITFAESCTGGQLAAAFTAISGASAVFNGSVVSYANTIKEQWLGVQPSTLAQHGAVSRECVAEMLIGVLNMAHADYAIAVSGIAGPTGGTPDKPVGTVYIGIQTPETSAIYHHVFEGNRESIQHQSVDFAIKTLHEMIKK